MGVALIPVALLAAGIWINSTQIRREETATNQRAQDEALRQYLDQMSNLIVDKKLREKRENSDVHLLAQARTTALLLELDNTRKRRPLKLVYRLHLINRDEPLLDLRNAALDHGDLSEITLTDACLKRIDLRMADLRGANLSGTDLEGTDLRGADLRRANLTNASLKGANLLPYDEQDPAKLNAPNLDGVDVSNVDLSGNNLKPTDLSDAILRGADLRGAYLRGAKGLRREQVEQASGDLTTRLPDGLEHPVGWSNSHDVQPNGASGDTNEAIKEVGKELVRTASLFAASVLVYRLLDKSRR